MYIYICGRCKVETRKPQHTPPTPCGDFPVRAPRCTGPENPYIVLGFSGRTPAPCTWLHGTRNSVYTEEKWGYRVG